MFFLLLFFHTGKGQEEKTYPLDTIPPQEYARVIKTNPVALMWGPIPFTNEYRLAYEFINSRNQSSQIGISFLGKSPLLSLIEDTMLNTNANGFYRIRLLIRGFRLQVQHKFYLSDLFASTSWEHYAPKGIYFSPHISYSTAKFTRQALNQYDIYVRASHFNINFLSGFQFLIFDNLAVDMFAGLGYKKNIWVERTSPTSIKSVNPQFFPLYESPVKFTLGFNTGIAF